jgi:heterotetrameric sarcosine oxidase gamma subunit
MASGAQMRSGLGAVGNALPRFRDGARLVLELNEIVHRSVTELAQPRAGEALDAALAAFHVDALPRIGASASVGGSSLLGIGPGQWLLIANDETAPGLSGAAPARAFAVAVESGDAWTQFAISGSASRDLLAKGCALDLHPWVFEHGACAVTRFAQLRCVLHRVGAGYRLLAGRSYAVSLAEWLNEAAAEFGLAAEAELSTQRPS